MSFSIFNDRERDTIVAALRFWQRDMKRPWRQGGDEIDLAENGRKGEKAALSVAEIDALCERLNKV